MLIVLGLFPAVSGFVQHIPEPVLGGATLVMFGTIAASGVRIVSREPLNRRAILIIALSLAVGLGVSQQPLILQFAPEWLEKPTLLRDCRGRYYCHRAESDFPTRKTVIHWRR